MDYEKTLNHAGDPKKALDFARTQFASLGYRLIPVNETSFEAVKKRMPQKGASPISGVSHTTVTATDTYVGVEAEFGNVRSMRRFLTFFLLGMMLWFVVLFGYLFGDEKPWVIGVAVLPFAPWVILLPLIVNLARRRAAEALDVLLDNMKVMAEEKE